MSVTAPQLLPKFVMWVNLPDDNRLMGQICGVANFFLDDRREVTHTSFAQGFYDPRQVTSFYCLP